MLPCDNVGRQTRKLYIDADGECVGKEAMPLARLLCFSSFPVLLRCGIWSLLSWQCHSDIDFGYLPTGDYPGRLWQILWNAQRAGDIV